MEQSKMNSANNEVVQQMERLSINKVQTPETALSLASLRISDQTHSTGVTAAPGFEAQPPCTQSSPMRPSTSAMDATKDIDVANTTSTSSPINPNVTKASIRHHQVSTDPRVRFDYKKRYFEYCLNKRETLLHLAAPKGEIELAKRALTRARLEYGKALRELRRATKTRVAGKEINTIKVGEGSGLMKEEVVLGGISDDIVMEEYL